LAIDPEEHDKKAKPQIPFQRGYPVEPELEKTIEIALKVTWTSKTAIFMYSFVCDLMFYQVPNEKLD
jgi:hypothetical protein